MSGSPSSNFGDDEDKTMPEQGWLPDRPHLPRHRLQSHQYLYQIQVALVGRTRWGIDLVEVVLPIAKQLHSWLGSKRLGQWLAIRRQGLLPWRFRPY